MLRSRRHPPVDRQRQPALCRGDGAEIRALSSDCPPMLYDSAGTRCAELKLVNRVAALAWQHVFGFAGCRFHDQAHSRPGLQCDRRSAARLPARLPARRRHGLRRPHRVHARPPTTSRAASCTASARWASSPSMSRTSSPTASSARSAVSPARPAPPLVISVVGQEDLDELEPSGSDHAGAAEARTRSRRSTVAGREPALRVDRRRPHGAADHAIEEVAAEQRQCL